MAKRVAMERYEVEWQELTEKAKARSAADPEGMNMTGIGTRSTSAKSF